MVPKLNKTKELEERIERIENVLDLSHTLNNEPAPRVQEEVFVDERRRAGKKVKREAVIPKLTFNQIITFLGITGIIIGAISFFFYAVANNWIGEAGQIAIGVLIGFMLFGTAFILRGKNPAWSNIVFGGAYFIEYLSLGIGVNEYRVLPEIVALILATVFLISSLALTLKFNSRMIAYFSLVGGYLIPFITGYAKNDLFVLSFTILITIALLLVSQKYNWADLRGASFFVITILIGIFNYDLSKNPTVAIVFLSIIYLLFNVSSIIFAVKNNKDINIIDTIILVFLPIVILANMYSILDMDLIPFGFIVLVNSFIYLAEIMFVKSINKDISPSMKFSLLGSGFTLLNFGLFFILKEINMDIFMIIFIVQWLLFGYFSKIIDTENNFYKILSYIFLGLIAFWYLFILRFNEGAIHASLYMIVLASVVGGFLFLNKKDIDKDINGAFFLVSIFIYIFSFSKYIWYWGIRDEMVVQIILSIMWLVYTLSLLIFVDLPKKARTLVIVMLSITLLKIAFRDLLYLDTGFRIIGFIIFGILLLVGGFFIKNEK